MPELQRDSGNFSSSNHNRASRNNLELNQTNDVLPDLPETGSSGGNSEVEIVSPPSNWGHKNALKSFKLLIEAKRTITSIVTRRNQLETITNIKAVPIEHRQELFRKLLNELLKTLKKNPNHYDWMMEPMGKVQKELPAGCDMIGAFSSDITEWSAKRSMLCHGTHPQTKEQKISLMEAIPAYGEGDAVMLTRILSGCHKITQSSRERYARHDINTVEQLTETIKRLEDGSQLKDDLLAERDRQIQALQAAVAANADTNEAFEAVKKRLEEALTIINEAEKRKKGTYT